MSTSTKVGTIKTERDAGMTIREAAAYMGCSYNIMVEYIEAGLVRWYPIGASGKHKRITRSACDELRVQLRLATDPARTDEVVLVPANPYGGSTDDFLHNIGM